MVKVTEAVDIVSENIQAKIQQIPIEQNTCESYELYFMIGEDIKSLEVSVFKNNTEMDKVYIKNIEGLLAKTLYLFMKEIEKK